MRIIDRLLSRWFTPKQEFLEVDRAISRYQDVLNAIGDQLGVSGSFSYLDLPAKVGAVQRDFLGNEERWRSLEKDLAREVEANSLFARKMQAIGKFLLGEEIPLASVTTDEFYDRIDLESRILRADNQRYYLHLHKIGAIALQDNDFESSLGSVSKDDADRIMVAIESLRERVSKKDSLVEVAIADLKEENKELRAREANYIDSLQLSQQEVKAVQVAFADTVDKVSEFYDQVRGAFDKLGCLDQIQI